MGDLFVALDPVPEAAAPLSASSARATSASASPTRRRSFDVVTSGDRVLFRPPADVGDDIKVKIVGRVRELVRGGRPLPRSVQGKWPKTWSPRRAGHRPGNDRDERRDLGATSETLDGGDGGHARGARRVRRRTDPVEPLLDEPGGRQGASIAQVWQRVGSAPIPESADVVVGVAGHNDKLLGAPIGGGTTWTFAHPLDSRPVVTGNVDVGSGGDGPSPSTKDSRCSGAGRPGASRCSARATTRTTVVTFHKAGGVGNMLLARPSGRVVRQIGADKPLGAPAVLGRLAFVPWADQYVSVVDLANGDEAAPSRSASRRAARGRKGARSGSAGRVHPLSRHIKDAFEAWPRERAGTRAARLAEVDAVEGTRLPWPMRRTRCTSPVRTGPTPAPPSRTTAGTRPTSAWRWGSARARKLAWVLHGADFVGGAAASGGVLCDEQGKVVELDAKTVAPSARWTSAAGERRAWSASTPAAANGTPTDACPCPSSSRPS